MDACILTTLNKHVDEMNATIQARTDGEERTYKSADFFGPDAAEEEGVYPVEVLNTLTPSGMAPHQLTLRVGAPVVFLRNLNRDQGMMNGTRGVILALRPWSVQVKLTTGPRSGESFVVPRINLTASDSGDDHIRFIRRQLPLRLAYCMTINKAQGQTFRPATSLPQGSYRLERGFAPSPHTVVLRCVFFPSWVHDMGCCACRVAVWLPSPVFSHGQLYVALSRVGEASALRVAAAATLDEDPMVDGVRNLVWRELLQ